jgi:hypothetical protein
MNDTTVWCQNPSVTEPRRDGGGVADGEGKSWREYPLSPATAGALPKGEPKDTCIFRGMGLALCRRCLQRCNTKAKLV